MGYRSNVMVLIYPDSDRGGPLRSRDAQLYEQLKVLMNTTFKSVVDDYFGSCMSWLDELRVLKFDIQDVKWYDSYSEVIAFEAMLDKFQDPTEHEGQADRLPGYCIEYMRVGEDYADVESRVKGEYPARLLSLRRVIECDV